MANVSWETEADPVAAGMDAERLERLTEHFRTRYVEPGKLPGCQLVVARGGVVAYARSLGLSDREAWKTSKLLE